MTVTGNEHEALAAAAGALAPEGDSPRVSIGLPVYNGERYVANAIEAIQAQDFGDWELIISDNASTDATAEICQRYAETDPRIRYVRGVVNRGASWNYNITFWLARGEMFRWNAHDDLCDPTMLRKCVEALDANPDAILAYAWTRFIGDEGEPLREVDDRLKVTAAQPHLRLKSLMRNLRDSNAVFGVIRRSELAKTRLILPFHPSDVPLLYELSLLGPFAEVPEHLFYRRMHVGASLKANISRRDRMKWYDPSAGRGLFLGARLLRTHIDGIRRAEIPRGQKRKVWWVLATVWPVEWARRVKRYTERQVKIALRRARGEQVRMHWE